MKKIVTTLCALLLVMQSASAWNRSIHAGIAAIAHDNLTEQDPCRPWRGTLASGHQPR